MYICLSVCLFKPIGMQIRFIQRKANYEPWYNTKTLRKTYTKVKIHFHKNNEVFPVSSSAGHIFSGWTFSQRDVFFYLGSDRLDFSTLRCKKMMYTNIWPSGHIFQHYRVSRAVGRYDSNSFLCFTLETSAVNWKGQSFDSIVVNSDSIEQWQI